MYMFSRVERMLSEAYWANYLGDTEYAQRIMMEISRRVIKEPKGGKQEKSS